MIRNILKVFFRNNFKHTLSFSITVIGFGIGIAAAVMISMFIYYEYSFESIFKNHDRIIRVSATSKMPEKSIAFATNLPALAPALKSSIPEIETFVRVNKVFYNGLLNVDNTNNIKVNNLLLADSTFFRVFNCKFIEGNERALAEPGQLVLTASLASKLFNNKKALGQSVYLNGKNPLRVGAVIDDLPGNTHLKFEGLVSWATSPEDDIWNDAHTYTYLLVQPHTSLEILDKKVNDYVKGNQFIAAVESSLNAKLICELTPIDDIHLQSNRHNELSENGSEKLIFVLITIAAFFLIISIFNYVNISLATLLTRMREIAVRKVWGASANMIRFQFFFESLMLILLAFVIAFVITLCLLHQFNGLVGQQLPFSILFEARFLLVLFILIIVVTLLSGGYTGFYLSSLNTIQILNKKETSVNQKKVSFRAVLIALQLTIATGVLICTFVVTSQLHYVTNVDVGFSKENVLIVDIPNQQNVNYFQHQLRSDNDVKSLSFSDYDPGSSRNDEFSVEQEDGQPSTYNFQRMNFDHEFLKTVGLRLKEGRNFDLSYSTDSAMAYLVNESLVRFMRWKNPIGKKIEAKNFDRNGIVIGVVKDASFYSLHQQTAPVIIALSSWSQLSGEALYIKFKTVDFQNFLIRVKQSYQNAFGGVPFQYRFLDDTYENLYKSDQRYNRIIAVSSALLFFISCLGLFSFSSFLAIRNKRQFGVRKVLGASVFQISFLYMQGFLRIALIGCVIACPVALIVSWMWLQTFTLRINIQWWIFLAASVLCLVVVLLTTSFHALRLAATNPIKVLRD